MNKHELVRNVAAMTGEKIGTVETVLGGITEMVMQNLSTKQETNLGFAKIKTVEKPARTGRNPATGGSAEIPAKTAVKVVVGKALKDAANRTGK